MVFKGYQSSPTEYMAGGGGGVIVILRINYGGIR